MGGGLHRPSAPLPEGWDRLADRAAVMQRLQQALEERLTKWTAGPAEITSRRADIVREAEIVAVLAEVLTQAGMLDADDPQYAGHCRRLVQAARDIVESVKQDRFPPVPAALDQMRKSCADCHETYRG